MRVEHALLAGLIVLVAWLAVYARWMKMVYRQRGLLGAWPIRRAALHEVSERFRADVLGPGFAAEVTMIGRGPIMATGATSDVEAWVLGVLAKDAMEMFEFGTATGRTSYLWARNSPSGARIATLTLAPGQAGAYRRGSGDAAADTAAALAESRFDRFLYEGSDVAGKVTQLFGDSKSFDETPWLERCDLVFVDGSHARSYVESDTARALRMVKPGGLVLWHDYSPLTPGVFRTLNRLRRRLQLVHLGGTTLVAWRRPAGGGDA
jgi:predicted O-methyltransferase YrrM